METSKKPRKRFAHLPAGFAAVAAVVALGLTLASVEAVPASTAEASGSFTVAIPKLAYHPGTLEIAKGSTVVFSNSSSFAHTATDAGAFDTGRIRPGASVSVRFTQKGVFPYHCKIHKFMHGKIVVG
ncbi:MAG TPA: plastocyanin/azurin family copper-binding protein [Solirubrobacterales bacterium]